jgi:hypothetical protein
MNLRAIANAAIQGVNPNIAVTYLASSGSTTSASGRQTPTYAAPLTVQAQVQAATGEMLKHVQPISQQAVYRNVRTVEDAQGIVRVQAKGGDLFRFPLRPGEQSYTWKVVHVLETWPEWCSVVVELQTDPPPVP